MATVTDTSLDVETLNRALTERDPGLLTGLYSEDAECTVIDATNPPSEPMRLRGKDEIGQFNEKLMGPIKHRIDQLVASQDEAAFAVDCEYENGDRVYATLFSELDDGKISRQVCVQAWDE